MRCLKCERGWSADEPFRLEPCQDPKSVIVVVPQLDTIPTVFHGQFSHVIIPVIQCLPPENQRIYTCVILKCIPEFKRVLADAMFKHGTDIVVMLDCERYRVFLEPELEGYCEPVWSSTSSPYEAVEEVRKRLELRRNNGNLELG